MKTPRPRYFSRAVAAVAVYLIVVGIFSLLHDYPQFRSKLQQRRDGDVVVLQRPWLNIFYFINEAGSGIKFLLSGDEKHMRHYPSPSHLLAAREGRASNGDWQAQLALFHMYYVGNMAPQDREQAMYWLQEAQKNAPPQQQAEIGDLIRRLKTTEAAPR